MGEKCITIKDDGKQCGSWAKKGFKHCIKHLDDDEKKMLNISESVTTEDKVSGLFDNEPKVATKPWNQQGNPWARDLLRLEKKHPGFVPRFVENTPESIQKRIEQGWVIADKRHYGGVTQEIAGESGKMSTNVIRRELILMELPAELAKKRKEYYNRKSNDGIEKANKLAKDAFRKAESATGENILLENRFESRRNLA